MFTYENKIKEIDELQKEINSYRPLQGQQLKELREYYKIGLTYSSNALEGNSLTETETKIVLDQIPNIPVGFLLSHGGYKQFNKL